MTVTCVAVPTTKFPFGMYESTVDSDVGRGDFSLEPGILYMCKHAHVQSHMCPGTDCS